MKHGAEIAIVQPLHEVRSRISNCAIATRSNEEPKWLLCKHDRKVRTRNSYCAIATMKRGAEIAIVQPLHEVRSRNSNGPSGFVLGRVHAKATGAYNGQPDPLDVPKPTEPTPKHWQHKYS